MESFGFFLNYTTLSLQNKDEDNNYLKKKIPRRIISSESPGERVGGETGKTVQRVKESALNSPVGLVSHLTHFTQERLSKT